MIPTIRPLRYSDTPEEAGKKITYPNGVTFEIAYGKSETSIVFDLPRSRQEAVDLTESVWDRYPEARDITLQLQGRTGFYGLIFDYGKDTERIISPALASELGRRSNESPLLYIMGCKIHIQYWSCIGLGCSFISNVGGISGTLLTWEQWNSLSREESVK